jgi:hypothetical protein
MLGGLNVWQWLAIVLTCALICTAVALSIRR